jgi:hypothetical protein
MEIYELIITISNHCNYSLNAPLIVVPKKNGKLKICVDFRKFNVATKKDPYSLPFIDEVINIVTGHEVYTFLDGFFRYHHISIVSKD